MKYGTRNILRRLKMDTKNKRQKRFQQKHRHIERQVTLRRFNPPAHEKWWWPNARNEEVKIQPHRYHKMKALDCSCSMCGNPRYHWGEKTMQEKKFECQSIIDEKKDPIGKWEWEDLNDPLMEW